MAVDESELAEKPEPVPVKRRIFLRLVRKRKKPEISEKPKETEKSEPPKKQGKLAEPWDPKKCLPFKGKFVSVQ